MSRALGRYELLRPLARGGMAEVYLARRRAAGIEKLLVVKRMRPETSGDPRFLDLFVREARLSMSLVHQNIVPVFDFGKIDDQLFLAMERVEGKDLGSSLARAADHRLPPLLTAFIATECCQALDYAHQRKGPDGIALGIVHRDVTPRNVLLSWSGEVKLTDFGIAAIAGDASRTVLGTPLYMAPEQARSEPTDPRADIYAIGLVMREALSGRRSRPGTDRETILEAARRGDLLPWSHLAVAPAPPAPAGPVELATGSGDHSLPPAGTEEPPPDALVAIIDRATAVNPDDRYPDVRAMLEALDGFIIAERSAHKSDPPARQLATWLAAVWEGARDDAEINAAIHAEHLVSFLDDGALDVIGTGTIRSLAMTDADDARLVVPVGLVAPASPAPQVGASPAAGSPARSAGPAVRPSQISSAKSSVVSGAFRVIPSPDGSRTPPAAGAARANKSRRLPLVLGMLVVAGALGAVAGIVGNDYRKSGQTRSLRPAAGQPAPGPLDPSPPRTGPPTGTGQAGTEQSPDARPPHPGASETGALDPGRTGPAAAGPPNSGTSDTGRPDTGPAAGPSASGQATDPPGTRTPGSGRPSAGRPRPGASATSQPATGPPGSIPSAPPDGSAAAAVASSAERPGPAGCRVRINLTPWAYYTADDDPTRHETPGTIVLGPGAHRLHVWNPELHVERDITISVPADRDTMNYSAPLEPPSLVPGAAPTR